MKSLAPAGSPVPATDAVAEAVQQPTRWRKRIDGLGPSMPPPSRNTRRSSAPISSTPRQDLIDSIRGTEKAIQEIDQVSRQEFAEALLEKLTAGDHRPESRKLFVTIGQMQGALV